MSEPAITPVFAWMGNELIVLDEVAAKKIRRKKLSASSMKGLTHCPARWAFESATPKTDDPFAATTLGTEMHSIYEVFYDDEKVPVDGRDREVLERMILARADELWGEHTLTSKSAAAKRSLEANRKKWIKEVSDRVYGILKIESPKEVEVFRGHMTQDRRIVYAPEDGSSPVSGLELSADGIQIAGIDFIGYIDRVRVDGYDKDGIPFLVPEDYKSSKRVPYLKRGDSDDDGDQVVIYAEVIRILTGFLPEKVRLLYTKPGKERTIRISETRVNRAVKRFVEANSIMDRTCSAGAFDAEETTFCSWCPLVDTCPTARAAGKDRAATNVNPVNLGIPTVRALGATRLINRNMDELPVISEDAVVPVTRTWEDMQDGGAKEQSRPEVIVVDQAVSEEPEPAENIAVVPTMMVSDESAEPDSERDESMSKETPLLSYKDKPAYVEFVDDEGNLNPNSYASMAVFGLTELSVELLVKESADLTKRQIEDLTFTFAKVVNRAFYALTGKRDGDSGVSLWQSGLTTRIRGALRTVLNAYSDIPIVGGEDADWEDWIEKTVRRIVVIAQVAVTTWEQDHTEINDEPTWDAVVERWKKTKTTTGKGA